jgi:16S rRNA (uracil1498-N3)-methyltransferase
MYEGNIVEAHHKRCRIEISKTNESEIVKPYLHIAIAPTKNMERLEWFIEKATEIGIDELTPMLCQHSERKQLRLDRLEKIAVSAMKQSGRWHLPKVNELTPFKQFIKRC